MMVLSVVVSCVSSKLIYYLRDHFPVIDIFNTDFLLCKLVPFDFKSEKDNDTVLSKD